jgi:hypothetical protein
MMTAPMPTLSPDGTVRLQLQELQAIALVHLISGCDEDTPLLVRDGACTTTISGFTEWVNAGQAYLTLGWDFQLQPQGTTLMRLGEPRSNIVLIDDQLTALAPDAAGALLSRFVDTLAWQEITLAALSSR